ncbi:hypothetical protein M407DRAFT_223117 [Tulasnella calospora MUT 4182]|uniref:Uncharacterized protein n=1 Tax=Tulasnella calospora MUT 4182 TaxID=1051891 RepID=A0A0C3PWJ1_9AGAM|nr:hypothetical protein M407DRAFT_223117 [Tulasnella calospora MUT 4182]
MLSDRVAIIPPLTPDLAHVGGKPKQVPPINFGEIFDIPRLRKELNWPVLEWSEVKKAAYDVPLSYETTPMDGVVMDELGCWGVRTVGNKGNKDPGHSVHEMLLQLDCSYTVLPNDALASPDNYHVKVWSMAAALFPDGRKRVLDANTARFPTQFGKKEWIAPDEQLAVFDNTYGVSAYIPYEWFQDFSPMWRFVGRYLHFTPRVEGIADEYVRRMFGLGKGDAVPLYIVLHIRRADWSKPCEENHPGSECAAPLSVFAARIEEVKRGLTEKYGPGSAQSNVTAVVVTSDERDKKWWQTVADQGWHFVDYDKEDTVKTFGRWYPSVIDSVIQSRAIGAVGVKGSTMSMMAERRVRDWNGGVATEVSAD